MGISLYSSRMVFATSCNNTSSNDVLKESKVIPFAPIIVLMILETRIFSWVILFKSYENIVKIYLESKILKNVPMNCKFFKKIS